MASQTLTKIIPLARGYATDLSLQEREVSHLRRAENVTFEVSGAVRKVGGGTRLNSSALTGGPSVLGQFDYWRAGTAGSFAQRFVVTTSDSKVYSEDPGTPGTFTDVTGGATIGANAIPVFCVARDVLTIFWSDASVPLQFDQTNLSTLTNAPRGRCACFHAGRLWTATTNANPSRLSYSAYTSITTWTGPDTGSIEQAFNPDDGDRIVGLASHKGALIVFKGPNKGSIFVVTGTDPESFSVEPLVTGIPLQTHNSIIAIGDDLFFMSDRGIHSLSATARQGNFEFAAISQFLFSYFRTGINRTRLANVWGVDYASKGAALWALTNAAGSINNEAIGLSYARADEGLKPFVWTLSDCESAGIRIHPTTKQRELIFGDDDGFLIRMDQSTRIMPASTAYTGRITTPSIIVAGQDRNGLPRIDQPVTLKRLWLRTQPHAADSITVNVKRDEKSAESYTFTQGTSASKFGSSQWGTAQFGSTSMQTEGVDILGECRSVQLDILQGTANGDMDLYECGLEYTPSASDANATLA